MCQQLIFIRLRISIINSNEAKKSPSNWKAFGKDLEKIFHIFPIGFCSFKSVNNTSDMHRNLILEAFQKAMAQEKEIGLLSPSKSKAAQLLSDYIEQEFKFQFGERRLRDYFNAASQGEDIELKQKAVRDGLAKYLGHESYRDFSVSTSEEEKDLETEKPTDSLQNSRAYFLRNFFDRNRKTFLIILG